MRNAARDKALGERSYELPLWRKWRRERIEALLDGPYGQTTKELLAFLKTANNSRELLAHIDAGPLQAADKDTRLEVLGLIDVELTQRRQQMNLPPFDDALPFLDQPENVFLLLRARLADENLKSEPWLRFAYPAGACVKNAETQKRESVNV
jgi:hypothetical protein